MSEKSLHSRLTEIDPYFRNDQLVTVLANGKLKKINDFIYGFYDSKGANKPAMIFTREFVEERGIFGEVMDCVLVDYVSHNGRNKFEVVTRPLVTKNKSYE